jgi:hypothetical protein
MKGFRKCELIVTINKKFSEYLAVVWLVWVMVTGVIFRVQKYGIMC